MMNNPTAETAAANSGVGQKQTATLTATASGYYMLYTASVHARATAGDILDAAARIKIGSASKSDGKAGA